MFRFLALWMPPFDGFGGGGGGGAPERPVKTPKPFSPLHVLALVGLFIGVLLLLFLSWWRENAGFQFASQIMLLIIAIDITPTITRHLTKRWGIIARMMLEMAFFTSLILVFSVWLLKKTEFGVWIAYVIGLILLLQLGGHLVERNKEKNLNRLSQSVLFENLKNDAEAFDKMFHNEKILYFFFPFGLIIGTIVGLIFSWTPSATVVFCLLIILLLASFGLLYFLVVAFWRMSDPFFKNKEVPSTKGDKEKNQEQKNLDLANMATDLRKLYFYDALHNTILLVAFVAVILSLQGVAVNTKWLIGSLIGGSFVFNQVPYVIGQSLLHEKLLEQYEGTKHTDMAEKLKKYAPRIPMSDFMAALFTSGTTGGLVYYLLDQLLKNVLK